MVQKVPAASPKVGNRAKAISSIIIIIIHLDYCSSFTLKVSAEHYVCGTNFYSKLRAGAAQLKLSTHRAASNGRLGLWRQVSDA